MKLIKEGKKPKAWFLGYWECQSCGAIIELEETDEEKVKVSQDSLTIMHLDQCPSCHDPSGTFRRASTSTLSKIRGILPDE
jgi:rubrerythrin